MDDADILRLAAGAYFWSTRTEMDNNIRLRRSVGDAMSFFYVFAVA
jgi:hypothetical protein